MVDQICAHVVDGLREAVHDDDPKIAQAWSGVLDMASEFGCSASACLAVVL
ncbi:MAG: hypothetical protein OXC65_03180 [Thiotrichales bacterium]|nr:hypothetical protein [Thiotrichales bacterium]